MALRWTYGQGCGDFSDDGLLADWDHQESCPIELSLCYSTAECSTSAILPQLHLDVLDTNDLTTKKSELLCCHVLINTVCLTCQFGNNQAQQIPPTTKWLKHYELSDEWKPFIAVLWCHSDKFPAGSHSFIFPLSELSIYNAQTVAVVWNMSQYVN